MKPKTMILMGLAITCGLGASYMTSRLLAERQSPDEPERVDILVASRNLNVHERITKPEEMFVKKSVLKDAEPADAIHDFDAVKGKVLKQGRNQGDHVTAANLYDKVTLEIPEGYQAVGLPVDLRTTLHGLATLPGSRVNLHLTLRATNPEATRAFVLLENVLVLAADIETTAEGKIAAPAQVVTFALMADDALKVAAAKEMGIISMILRKPEDKSKVTMSEISGLQIIRGGTKPEPEKPIETAKVDPKPRIEDPKKVEPPVVDQPRVVEYEFQLWNGSRVESTRYSKTESGEIRNQDSNVTGGSKKPQVRKHSGGPPLDQ